MPTFEEAQFAVTTCAAACTIHRACRLAWALGYPERLTAAERHRLIDWSFLSFLGAPPACSCSEQGNKTSGH
jgi:hypothetical protein